MSDPLDLIERYFDDLLSDSERKDFENRLTTDEQFAQAFQLEKDLMDGIEMMGNKNLKEDLKVYYKEEVEEKEKNKASTKPNFISRRMWLAAASIAVLLIAFWWMNRPTPERLYAEYFQPDFDFVEKGDADGLAVKAEAALKAEDYKRAFPLLEELVKVEPKRAEYILALGIALVEVENYHDAIPTLLRAGTASRYSQNEALWYYGLALLKQGNLEESYIILKQIPEYSARYKEATALAKKIKP